VLLLLYPLAIMLLCLVFRNYDQQLIDQRAVQAAEDQAMRERAILRTLIDTLPDLVWLKDANGVYLSCNRRFEQFFGAREQDIVGKTDYDFVDKDLADSFRAHDRAAMEKNGPSVNEEEIAFASDGHREMLETTKTPMRDEKGSLIGVLGIGHDITERKLSGLALENSEKQLRFVLAGSGLGFWDWDIAAGKVERNEQWAALLGYSHDEIKDTTRQWTDFIHPEDRERAWDSISAVLEGRSDKHRLEYRMFHKDGSVRWILDQASVMQRDRSGKPLRMCGTHADITVRKQNELELLQHRHHLQELVEAQTRDLLLAKDAAEAANRAKSAFLANMSHELRTPINGVMGMIELARRRMADPQGRDQLDKAKGAADRLLAVLNDILDLSRIEAERMILEDTPLQIGAIVDNINSLLGHKAAEKGLTLQTDIPADLAHLSLRGDPLRLGQVLTNLVGNAVKFTERGGVTLRGRPIDETPEAVRVRFEVIDTGNGIDTETQARLFRSFEQADNSMTRKYGGTGLGLAICKRLVRLMGGGIGMESTPGRGSTFWFVVPLRKRKSGAVEPAPTFVADGAERRWQTEFAGKRVLLAEDEPITQEVARVVLEDVGLVVDSAENGQQALDLARRNRYALILMDMQMPVLNGVDAARAIRADSANRDTPILAMTANAFDEDRQTCLDAGMNDHIVKPVSPEVLYQILLAWLEKGKD
jgi:PAS domain S-box-containing protein